MKKIIVLTLLLFLTACSSKYELRKHYISPIDTEGKLRIQECLKDKETCQLICNQKREECLLKKEETARKNFPNLLIEFVSLQKIYKEEMRGYKSKMESWDHEYKDLKDDLPNGASCRKSFSNGYSTYSQNSHNYDENDDECSDATETSHQLFLLENRRPYKPTRPISPDLARNIKKLQEECLDDCSCTKKYDGCFTSSGGRIQYKKVYLDEKRPWENVKN